LGGPYETDLMDSPLVKFEVEHLFMFLINS